MTYHKDIVFSGIKLIKNTSAFCKDIASKIANNQSIIKDVNVIVGPK